MSEANSISVFIPMAFNADFNQATLKSGLGISSAELRDLCRRLLCVEDETNLQQRFMEEHGKRPFSGKQIAYLMFSGIQQLEEWYGANTALFEEE